MFVQDDKVIMEVLEHGLWGRSAKGCGRGEGTDLSDRKGDVRLCGIDSEGGHAGLCGSRMSGWRGGRGARTDEVEGAGRGRGRCFGAEVVLMR